MKSPPFLTTYILYLYELKEEINQCLTFFNICGAVVSAHFQSLNEVKVLASVSGIIGMKMGRNIVAILPKS